MPEKSMMTIELAKAVLSMAYQLSLECGWNTRTWMEDEHVKLACIALDVDRADVEQIAENIYHGE